MLSLITQSAEPLQRLRVGRWKGRKDAAPVTVRESHQPLLGSKLSFHGWQLEINAALTDELNKCVQQLFGTNVDLQYCPAKPALVLKVHQEITPETKILSFCRRFLLQRIQTTLKLLAGNY